MQKINEILLEENQKIRISYLQEDEDGLTLHTRFESEDIFKANDEVNELKLCSNIHHLTIELIEALTYGQNQNYE